MASMYFVGEVTLGFIVTRIGDISGRKWPMIVSTIVSVPVHLGLILSRSLTLNIVLFFLFGACVPGKIQICYVYMNEMIPSSYRNIIGTMTLFADSGSITLIALYFRFITKDWVYF